jgi:IS30 family transposase
MSYTHLTEKDRYVISHLTVAGFSLREIARRLGRHHSTISRELKRAKSIYPYARYWYDWTQPLAIKRYCKARHYRRQNNLRLVRYVEKKLRRQ